MNIDVLKEYPDNYFDSVVTDPPYGLQFMNKKWDYDVPSTEIWKEVYRVLKPGAHLLAFSGTRTYHRMVCPIEDAGFEIRDQIGWAYGSGFPKSLDVSKAIDKAAGAEREVIGKKQVSRILDKSDFVAGNVKGGSIDITAPATDAGKQWQGWGTALKPAWEPICVARKPLEKDTVAENVLEYGTGALNIDESRVETKPRKTGTKSIDETPSDSGNSLTGSSLSKQIEYDLKDQGRWPANIIHDGSYEVVSMFPESKSEGNFPKIQNTKSWKMSSQGKRLGSAHSMGDVGSAARFFYCAKTSKADREEGLDEFIAKHTAASEFRPNHMEKALEGESGNPYGRYTPLKNNHPTVKPTALMEYLIKLITPPGGIVLDPFMGSGSTGKAAMRTDFKFVGIDLDENYCKIAQARIEFAITKKPKSLLRMKKNDNV